METERIASGFGAALRQWRQPKEFRIQASAWPADAIAALAGMAQATGADGGGTGGGGPDAAGDARTGTSVAAPPVPGTDAEPSGEPGLPGRSVADVATSLWRLRNRLAGSAEAPRAVARHLETAWDALADAGVEIRDHLNDPFDPGLSLTVVAFQPTPGLRREQVIETIRPGVYLGSRPIQTAEVIVGTPDPPETPAPGAEEMRTR